MEKLVLTVNQFEKDRINEFISALRTPCNVVINRDSVFNDLLFEGEFRSKLLTHHSFMGSPLFQESFESAFVAACRKSRHTVEEAPQGKRFWDVMIDGRRISLKSSKAASMRMGSIHISKLTEAAWIQDCRTATLRKERTFQLFEQYTSEVDSIIMLRYFASTKLYELVEIPVSMFSQIFSVDTSHFSADGPTINIPIGQVPPDFTLSIDRSDAKITIKNINKELCTVHGTWQIT